MASATITSARGTTITIDDNSFDPQIAEGSVIATVTVSDPGGLLGFGLSPMTLDGSEVWDAFGWILDGQAGEAFEMMNFEDSPTPVTSFTFQIVALKDIDFGSFTAYDFRFDTWDTDDLYEEGITIPLTIDEDAPSGTPTAADDTVAAGKNIRTVIDVLANDTDADGTIDLTSVTVVDGPDHGTVSVSATTGKITYTPTKDYIGADTFTYTVKDNDGNVSGEATVTIGVDSKITLTSANEAFVADAVAIGPVEVDGGAGDDYISGSSNPSTAGADKFYGGDGNDIIFGASGNDYIEGNAGDDYLRSGSGNDTLVGGTGNDTYGIRIFANKVSSTQDTGNVTIIDDDGVLWNGAPRPATVPAEWSSPPPAVAGYQISGTATLTGEDTWELTFPDDNGGTKTLSLFMDGNDLWLSGNNENIILKNYVNGTFGITLEQPVDPNPTAADDAVTAGKNIRTTIDVLANDTDADGTIDLTSVTVVDGPDHGTVSVNATTGKITYTPTKDYIGADTFTYTVKDNDGNVSGEATVTIGVDSKITLTSANEAFVADAVAIGPVEVDGGAGDDYISGSSNPSTAGADKFYGGEGNDIIFGAGGDDYIEGNAGNDYLRSGSGNDTLVGGEGTDTYGIRFFANKTSSTVDTGTVTIIDTDGVLWNGAPRPATVPSEWSSPPPAAAGYQITGTATVTGENTWSLVVNDDNGGTKTFALTLDGADLEVAGGNEVVTIKNYVNGTFGITLEEPVDPIPAAANDTASTVKDLSKVIDVLGNDTDADGTLDPTSVTIVDQPLHGTVTVNTTTGAITYKSAVGYVGADTFTYTVKDNDGNVSNVATVTLDVAAAHILTSGDDVFSGDSLNLTTSGIDVYGGAGDDYIVTSNRVAAPDNIYGGDGNDLIFTGSGNDYVEGGAGNDVIHARAGIDTVIGGEGDDTYVIRFTDAGTTTITDNDGTLWHGTFRPATYPSSWTPAPSVTSGFGISGTATPTEDGKWTLVVTETSGTVHTLSLSLLDGDLIIVETGKTLTVVIKDYVNGTFGITLDGELLAQDDTASTVKDVSKVIDVLGNDSDDGTLDPASVTVVDQPLHGTVTVNTTTGAITYKPAVGYVGADTFTYTVKDNDGNVSNVATVTLDVSGAHILTSGDDVFSGDSLNLTTSGIEVHGGAGDDYIVTSNRAAMPDKIYGDDGNDLIFTGSGDDYIEGGAGNDVIHARSGNDTVIGGAGDDTYVIRFTDAGTTTITDDDGALWHGTFRPASIPSSWTPAPSATSGFAISGEASMVSEGVWNLTVTETSGTVHNLTLSWTGGDLTIVEAGKAQTVVIKDYVNGKFGITLDDGNDAPTNLALSNSTVDENSAAGTVVGTLSATDPEGGAITYTLAEPSSFFEIVGNEVRVKGALDYETVKSHQIKVIAADAEGNQTQQTFTVGVNDVADTPSKGMITIDVSGSGLVGVDVEAYLRGGFISDTSGSGFPSFDNSGSFAGEEMFIGYGSGAASKYVLAHGELAYDFGFHTIAGTINTIEFGTRGTGTFDSNGYFTGGNAQMKITGLDLYNAVPTNGTEETEIEANGLVHLFGIAHMYGQSSDPATAARVAAALDKVADGLDQYAQHFIGSKGADTYVGTAYADEIEGGEGDDILGGGGGNDTIKGGAGNNVISGGSGDDTVVYDGLKSAFTVTTNSNGTVSVLNTATNTTDTLSGVEFVRFNDKIVKLSDGSETPAGEPPEDIELSSATVAENAAAGTVIGTLSAVDPDGGTVSFALATPSDKFEIVGTELRLKAGLDFETAQSHQVVVRVTDSFGSITDKTFTVGVTDVNEAPTGLKLVGSTTVAETLAVGSVIGTIEASDPEGGALTYSLTGASAGMFEIVDGKLKLASALDYETLKNHPITIVAKDAAGNTTTQAVTIKVSNVDEAPVSIELSGTTVVENAEVGTVVGTFSATDPEGGAVEYSLASNPSGKFAIVDNQLVVAKPANYEGGSSYTIKVDVIDVGGNVTQKTFTIDISDVDEAPVSLALTGNTVAENAAVGTVVGTFSASDPEGGALTYTLTDTAGGLFKLDGNKLVVAKAADYEKLKSDTVKLEVSDAAGNKTTKTFTISIDNVDEAPTSPTLSGYSVNENAAVGTVVGTFAATDPEGGVLTYKLTDTAGGLFKLDGNKLVVAKAADYEKLKSDTVKLEVSDAAGNKTTKTFTIGIDDVDEAPTAPTLSGDSVAENAAVGTVVGTFSATDPEGGVLTYKLTDTAGGLFKLDGNKLVVAKAADYEKLKSDTVTVEVKDAGGHKTTKTFTIDIKDVNEAPTVPTLTGDSVAENAAVGTVVGTFAATDPEGGTVTYKLTDTAGGLFKLDGNKLVVAKAVDYEKLKSDTVTVEVKDAGGHKTTKTFTIDIKDVNEAPTTITLTGNNVAENAKVNTVVGTFSALDPEGKALTYKLLDTADGLFKLDGNKLVVAKAADYESLRSDTINIEVKDAGGLTTTKTFRIDINDVMETINGTSKSETINGTIGADKILALDGNDTLNGGSGDDYLSSGNGNDKLYGGKGADDLYGGAGSDTFIFKAISDSTPLSTGQDTIFDFSASGGDMIDLSAIDANSASSGNQSFSFLGEADFSGKAGQLRYELKSSDTYIYGDIDGDKTADFVIHLDDAIALNKGYFIL